MEYHTVEGIGSGIHRKKKRCIHKNSLVEGEVSLLQSRTVRRDKQLAGNEIAGY
jgi:hypothetical protein